MPGPLCCEGANVKPPHRRGTYTRDAKAVTDAAKATPLAVCWRDARAGLLFIAGPCLAAIGALALLPLAEAFPGARIICAGGFVQLDLIVGVWNFC